ncbi:MAG TPA: nucleotidyltransferase family protein [Chitinophagales bacterium]|nr:nucleotidyltransferase family protein [Chitinophagales bacterium]HRK25896.1 nucleotidyltransferase family protein [Chitinophagales bacterium]
MFHFDSNLIYSHEPVKKALQQLNELPDSLTLFVLNHQNQMVGTLTDGDIRRGLLANKSVDDTVAAFMFTGFRYLRQNSFTIDTIKQLRLQRIKLVPLLNDQNRILRVYDLSRQRSVLPVDAVIMAGGRGQRLSPLTDTAPKPMLPVGGKPIIAYNVERLCLYGIHHLHISLNYLGEQIIQFFGNGSNMGMNIHYVTETQPLGTLGAVGLVEHFAHNTLLVMNSDLLTNIDFEDFYAEFDAQEADMMVASVPYEVSVPYAVLETDPATNCILSFKEKPVYTYQSNAGIYLIKQRMLQYLPHNAFYNATDLIETLIAKGHKVGFYPILGYWLDIGNPADYRKAQDDIRHIKF